MWRKNFFRMLLASLTPFPITSLTVMSIFFFYDFFKNSTDTAIYFYKDMFPLNKTYVKIEKDLVEIETFLEDLGTKFVNFEKDSKENHEKNYNISLDMLSGVSFNEESTLLIAILQSSHKYLIENEKYLPGAIFDRERKILEAGFIDYYAQSWFQKYLQLYLIIYFSNDSRSIAMAGKLEERPIPMREKLFFSFMQFYLNHNSSNDPFDPLL